MGAAHDGVNRFGFVALSDARGDIDIVAVSWIQPHTVNLHTATDRDLGLRSGLGLALVGTGMKVSDGLSLCFDAFTILWYTQPWFENQDEG